MVAPRRILIVGDGTGGLSIANKLAFRIPREFADITVIGNSPKHYYKPAGTAISYGSLDYSRFTKNARFLLSSHISYIRGEVTGVNKAEKNVLTRDGKRYYYDYLVLAPGARFAPEAVPGFEGEAKHFYDLNHSVELSRHIQALEEGNLVIGSPSGPIQCPPAPFEFALLADEYLRNKGVRDKVNITFFFPGKGVFGIPVVSEFVQKLFEDRGIEFRSEFTPKSISQKNKEINSVSGDLIKYSLLVMPPPHMGQKFIEKSGFKGDNGFVEVDPRTLQYRENPEIYVIGDAAQFNGIMVPKSGTAAAFQGGIVAEGISSEIGGLSFNREYDGEAICQVYNGRRQGFSIRIQNGKATLGKEAELDFHLKKTGADTYFSSIVRGMM